MTTMLPGNCTLRSLEPGIKNAPEFVRAVLANMAGYYKDCAVRIACDSSGAAPDYRVEAIFYDFIDGVEEAPENADRVWSTEAMHHSDVMQFLGELRGILPRPAN